MAKMKYAYPIEEVHGKLKGKFGVAQHKAANAKGNRDGYSVIYGTRTSDPSTAEVAARTKFGAINKIVALRKADPTKRAADQTGFKNQTTTNYKTLKQYIYAQAKAEYLAAQTQQG